MKSPVDVAKFDAELYAYQHWAPRLEGRTPELVAAERNDRMLVLSKLPGEVGDLSTSTFREAGRLLRRLQEAEAATVLAGFADSVQKRFDTWVQRAEPGVLDDAEIEFVDDQVQRLGGFPDPTGVPCHRDWQPRNWLTAPDGSVSVIDFGNSRVGYWYQDFERMWWAEWRARPELGRAFFEGYGRTLDDAERVQLCATSTLGLLTTIVWADEVGDDAFRDHGRTQLHRAMIGAPDPI